MFGYIRMATISEVPDIQVDQWHNFKKTDKIKIYEIRNKLAPSLDYIKYNCNLGKAANSSTKYLAVMVFVLYFLVYIDLRL